MRARTGSLPDDILQRWELYEEARPRFLRLARRLTGNSADAADLVQEVGLRVLRHPTGPDPDSSFQSWCVALLRNVAANQRRSVDRRARWELLGSGEAHLHAGQAPVDPDKYLELRRVVQRVHSLNGTARELMVRRYLLEETATEIAAEFSSTPPAIRMKLKRLRGRLHELLGATAVLATEIFGQLIPLA